MAPSPSPTQTISATSKQATCQVYGTKHEKYLNILSIFMGLLEMEISPDELGSGW